MPASSRELKQRILNQRGLRIDGQKRIVQKVSTIPEEKKTPSMKLIELRLKQPIEDILVAGSLSQVAAKTGLSPSTISKMKKRLNLNYTEYNLPNCQGCNHLSIDCARGECKVLELAGKQHLIPHKFLKILENGI